jgi:uncharacterized repeat protein (TIGR01451 family)
MKRLSLLLLVILLCSASIISLAQTPGVKWSRYYAAYSNVTDHEYIFDSRNTFDKGYVIAGIDTGYTFSWEELAKKYSSGRAWISRLDSNGNVVWRRNPPGVDVHSSGLTSVCIALNGNFVAAGYGTRIPAPTSDFFIVSYDTAGNKIWDSLFGGSGIDRAYSVHPTPDGGFIMAGYTTSNDGYVTGNHSPGIADAWVVKMGENGNFQWQHCYGGSGADTAWAIVPAADGGYFVAGGSTSSNGDLTGNNGLSDGWVFKINSTGTIEWRRNIGGTNHEGFRSMVLNADNSITLTGYTGSATVPTNGHKGFHDVWVTSLNGNNGSTIWSKCYGGSSNEHGFALQKTIGNGYLIGGYTHSTNGDVTGAPGSINAWLLQLANDGSLTWQKVIGGNRSEMAMSVHSLSEYEYAIAGWGGHPTPEDTADGYVVRLGSVATINGTITSTQPIDGGLVKAVKAGKEYATIPVNGAFELNVDPGTYTITYTPPNIFTQPGPFFTGPLDYFDTATYHFVVNPIPGIRDLVVNIVPLQPARPGFNVDYRLIYKNAGTEAIPSGQVLFKPDSGFNVISALPPASTVNGDTLKWDFTNLTPSVQSSITVKLQVQPPPNVNIGDTLTSIALIKPVENDVTPSDDTSIYRQIVIGSFDPNDKSEGSGGSISAHQVITGNYLNYLVRFQNTGNDTAFNIQVRDTLDSKLDWTSLQMIAASHPYQLQVSAQQILTWQFNNILLPDSNVNEPASHGFIVYRIKTRDNVLIGDTIKNSASIYFDFNLPVKTNTANTAVRTDSIVCPGGSTAFRTTIAGTGYQWQVDMGSGFVNVTNDGVHTGAAAAMLQLLAPPTSMNGYLYRCVVTTGGGPQHSPTFLLRFGVSWKGTTGTAWEDPANWNCGVLPDEFTEAIIPGGLPNYPEINMNTAIRSLLLHPSANITVKEGVVLDIRK